MENDNEPTIAEIEHLLGIDKIKPIQLTEPLTRDCEEDGEYFREWYEEDLRRFYKEICEGKI